MKLKNLFENSSYLGFYTTFPIDDSMNMSKNGSAVSIVEHVLKTSQKFTSVKLSSESTLVSTDHDELKELVTVLRNDHGLLVHDHIYFHSGDESVHDFSRFPRVIKSTIAFGENCNFSSLKGIEKHFTEIDGKVYCDGLKIKSHILGILKIKGVTGLSMGAEWRKSFHSTKNGAAGFDLEETIAKYLPASDTYQGGDIFDCQDELIELGFK